MVDTRLFHPDNGCLLQVLFGLHLLGRPARKRELGEMYGLCDEAIQNAIEKLTHPQVGLVLAVPSGRWPRYQLSEAGQQMLLPMTAQGLPRPAEQLPRPQVTPVATGVTSSDSGSDRSQLPQTNQPKPVESGSSRTQVVPTTLAAPSDSGPNRDQAAVSPALTPALTGVSENDSGLKRDQMVESSGLNGLAQSQSQLINLINSGDNAALPNLYAQTLRAGGVFPNIRRQLVPVLAAEGPAFLPHLIGHVAFAHSSECDQRPGVYVNDVARHRELCPPAWLPDLTLTFEQALALALQGQTHWQPEIIRPEPLPAEPLTEPPPAPDTPAAHWAQVWEMVLRQLRMEMPHHTFDLWLRDTHLLAVDDKAVIAVPTTYARDWLTNQLQSAIKRALAQLLGQGVEVVFVVEGS